jgi:uncharacterized protein (DUF305 family)
LRLLLGLKTFPQIVIAAMVPAALCIGAALTSPAHEKLFLDANEKAMKTMMAGMVIHASGDVDADFAAMMIPHHQGAIEMAKAELQYGTNEQLRRIAQEIIVDQEQEIAAMRLAVKAAHSK